MTHKKILPIFFSLVLLTSFTGCGKNRANGDVSASRWELNKETVRTAQELSFSTRLEDQEKYYCVADYQQFLNGPLSKDDILFFDYGKAYTEASKDDYEYDFMTYETMKKYAIDYNNINTDEDLTQFTLTAPKGSTNKACIIVNKDKTVSGEYIFATIEETLTADIQSAQEEFEAKYGKASKSGLVAKTVTVLATGLGSAIVGALTGEPGVIGCGLVNLINGFVGLFTGLKEPTIYNCLEKLYAIESRIMDLESKMSKNFTDIRMDSKITQAKIDKAVAELAQQNIDEFEKEEMFDLEKNSNVISNMVKGELKKIVERVNFDVEIPYYYNDQNVLTYRPLTEVAFNKTDKTVSVKIPSFANAKAALERAQNAFTKDVYNEFSLDVYNALEDVELPDQMTRALLCDYVVVRIVEQIVRDYYKIKTTDGVNYMNLVLGYAKRISGQNGASILTSYRTRFEYMYNFGVEYKRSFNTVIARIRSTLETQYANCVMACIWSGTDYDKLANAYDAAMDTIIDTATKVEKIADGYSFIIENNITANLYSTYTQSYFTNYGNFPTHHSKFCLYRYTSENINERVEIDSDNYMKYQSVTTEQHYQIILRMGYLVNAGVLDWGISYYDYLIKIGILPSYTTKAIKAGIEQKKIQTNPYQFIGEITHRQLTKDDKGKVNCYFTDRGKDKMHYFSPNTWCMYMTRKGEEYWHATCWETTTVDAMTNKVSENKWMMGLEGCYDEGHKYWITDERHRFNGLPSDAFFLAFAKEM